MKKLLIRIYRPEILYWLIFVLMVMSACTNNQDQVSPATLKKSGNLQLLLTDDPIFSFDNISKVNITISKIEIMNEGGKEEENSTNNSGNCECDNGEDSLSYVTVFNTPKVINLLDLRNGITSLLSDTAIQAGTYNMIRLYISDANVELTNGTSFNLTVPSGSTSGLKIFIPGGITIKGGVSSELLLDFDLNRSLVILGSVLHPHGFHLKPVIRAVDNFSCGKVEGHVTDTTMTALKGAYVWLKTDSIISSTTTEGSGFYQMIGIPEGTYNLFATMQGYDTTEIDNVHVSGRSKTIVDLKLKNVLF